MDCSLIYNIKAAVLGEFDHSRCINLCVLVPCSLFMWKTFPDLHTVQYLYLMDVQYTVQYLLISLIYTLTCSCHCPTH